MKLKNKFNDEQRKTLLIIGVNIEDSNYTDDEILEIGEKVSNYIMLNGFDDDYKPNDLCLIFESIMDVFGDM